MYDLKKGNFVDNELKNLLVALDSTVIDCKYFLNMYETEFVEVAYSNGSKEEICIDCADITEITPFVKNKGCGDEMSCRFKDIIGECDWCGTTLYSDDWFENIGSNIYCYCCADKLEKDGN